MTNDETQSQNNDLHLHLGYALPQRFYTSSRLYENELERIFYRHWLCVGHIDRVRSSGDYFLGRRLIKPQPQAH